MTDTVSLNLGAPTLPAETAGVSYTTTLSATGGSGHTSFTLLSGSLPGGLSLSSAGVITGTATVAGTSPFTVKATDTTLTGVSGTEAFSLTVNPAAAAAVSITAPGTAVAGMGFQVTVTATDAFGNPANGPVTLTSSDGQTVTPATLTLSHGTISSPITLDTAGTVTLTAAAGTAQRTSGSIAVSAAALSGLAISVPASATAGVPFTVMVKAADRFGNPVTSFNGNVTLVSSDGQKVTGSALTLTNGVGTGSVTLDFADNVRLIAVSTSLTPATSSAITVNPATPVVKVFAPTEVVAGAAFGVTVTAVDQFQNGFSGAVTLTSSDGQKVILTPSAVNVSHGVVSFAITLDTTDNLTLTATVDGISAASGSITVLPGAIASFTVTAPSTATAGTPFTVNVTSLDQFGNVVTTANGGVALISSDGQPASPGVVNVVKGVGSATVTLDKADTVMLSALVTGAKGVSNSITVNPAGVASFAVSAPLQAVAGTAFNVTFTAKDAFGNVATGFNGPVTLSSSGGQTVAPGTVTLTNGVATASVTLDKVGTVTLSAVAGTFKGVSNSITVSPGAPSIVSVGAPTTATAGTAFVIQIKATDAFGNAVTAPVSLLSSDGQKVFSGGVEVVNGAATAAIDLNTADPVVVLTADVGSARVPATASQ